MDAGNFVKCPICSRAKAFKGKRGLSWQKNSDFFVRIFRLSCSKVDIITQMYKYMDWAKIRMDF